MLDRILAMAPEDTAALNNKAIILWELGRRPEAVQTLQLYLSFEPYNVDALYNLMLLYDEQGIGEKALEYAESFLSIAEAADNKKTEDIVTAGMIAARAYTHAEVYYRALEMYAHIVELDPKRGEAWFEQAEILLTAVEDPSRGVEALGKALDSGFTDRKRIALLLVREDLLDRARVEDLLGQRSIMPPADELEAGRRSAATVRATTTQEPRGPWAEPGGFGEEPPPPPEDADR
jgi:tetratricopeptide (TPR) repeat protein